MPSLRLTHLTKSFDRTVVVEDFDLEVADGELVVLVGGSGSGKSTILRMLAGLESVTGGTIHIGDRDVTALPPRDRDVAMVFQDYALYPHMAVRENLSLGLRLRKLPAEEIARRVAWAAEMLGLSPLLDRRPKALSGGQRQRVAMGRAMVREPAVFLFDEPLSNLDAGLRAQMRIEIGSLQRRLATTTVYVTHDQVEAMTMADRIVVMNAGHIEQIGTPEEIYERPKTRFVAGFIGTPPMNFVGGAVEGRDGAPAFVSDGVRVALPRDRFPALRGGAQATLGIRPEDLVAVPAGGDDTADHIAGRVVLVEMLGGTSHVHIDAGPHRLLVAVTDDRLPSLGDFITVRVRADRAHLFGADGVSLR